MDGSYWRQFPLQLDFSKPFDTGWGRIIHLDELKTRDGLIPKITMKMQDDSQVILVAAPKQLRNRLIELAPAEGEWLRVNYLGEAEKAPHGMSPVKRFRVGHRKKAPTADGDGHPGGTPVAAPPPAEQAS